MVVIEFNITSSPYSTLFNKSVALYSNADDSWAVSIAMMARSVSAVYPLSFQSALVPILIKLSAQVKIRGETHLLIIRLCLTFYWHLITDLNVLSNETWVTRKKTKFVVKLRLRRGSRNDLSCWLATSNLPFNSIKCKKKLNCGKVYFSSK